MIAFFRGTAVTALLFGTFLSFLIIIPPAGGKAETVLQINYDPVKESISQLIWKEIKKTISSASALH